MLYQTFRKFPDGTIARFGRATSNLRLAIERAAAVRGEVRPLGSLTPVNLAETLTSGQRLRPTQPMRWPAASAPVRPTVPQPLKPAPAPAPMPVRIPRAEASPQSSVVRYYPAGRK